MDQKAYTRPYHFVAPNFWLTTLRANREAEQNDGEKEIGRIDARVKTILAPAIQDGGSRLDRLVERRLELEVTRGDEEQASNLRAIKEQIERTAGDNPTSPQKWEQLPAASVRKFCSEVEGVLKEWKWEGEGRVEFDEAEYDIKVDGQRRQSHGKGVRAVLYSAFVIGLLRYCRANGRPHIGTVVIDSPLTSYKKGNANSAGDGPVAAGVETAFWESLLHTEAGTQIIIIENKEPPTDVAEAINYEWYAGSNAQSTQRSGFIPPRK